MKSEPLELMRGSGNVYRDLGHPNADVSQLKAILAAAKFRVTEMRRFGAAVSRRQSFRCRDFLASKPEAARVT